MPIVPVSDISLTIRSYRSHPKPAANSFLKVGLAVRHSTLVKVLKKLDTYQTPQVSSVAAASNAKYVAYAKIASQGAGTHEKRGKFSRGHHCGAAQG